MENVKNSVIRENSCPDGDFNIPQRLSNPYGAHAYSRFGYRMKEQRQTTHTMKHPSRIIKARRSRRLWALSLLLLL